MMLTLLAMAAAQAQPALPQRQCNARPAQVLVGKRISPAVEARARKLSGARIVRSLPPGTIVTMEFRPDRLNIHLDRKGRIARLQCS